MRKLGGQIFQLTCKRPGPGRKADEDVSVPNVDRDPIEWIVLAAETVMHMRSADEAPVESIGPPVVATLNSSGKMSLRVRAESGTAMPAHVEKRPQIIVAIPSNDHTLAGYLAQKIVSRRRDLIDAPGTNPGLAVEALEFIPEQIRVSVVARGKSRCYGLGVRGRHSALGGHHSAINFSDQLALSTAEILQHEECDIG